MMRRLLTVLSLVFFAITFASCEKEVHIKLDSVPPALVVEGAIENGLPPYVILTTSLGFFSAIDLTTLENSFVHGAVVTVSDGNRTITLKEYALDSGAANHFYLYTIDTASLSAAIIGEFEKTYTLSINYNGKTYTSVAKIPNVRPVDSMWIGAPMFKRPSTPDSAQQLFINYTDPDTLGNYIRYFTKRNTEGYFGANVFDDGFFNGAPLKDFGLFAGYAPVQDANVDSLRYFYKGDTVSLKFSAIDKGVYDFWNTFYYAQQTTGNPFASPINVKTNISNGALGIWAGYGSAVRTLIVTQ